MKILITGATSGLGYALAKVLSKKGHFVYVGVKTEKEKQNLEEKMILDKTILFPISFNLLDEKDQEQLETLDLDVLFLQAGIGEGGCLSEINLSKMKENYEINLFSNLSCIQKFLQICDQKKKRGKIFVTSSLLAHLPFPYLGSYGSSKASLSYCIKTLQLELFLQKKKHSLTLVEPGAFHTGFNQVMLENQERNQKQVSWIDQKICRIEHLIFVLIESFSFTSFVNCLSKEIQKENPQKLIRMPKRQVIGFKLYQLYSLLFY